MSKYSKWPTTGSILLVSNLENFITDPSFANKKTQAEQVAFDYAKEILTKDSPRNVLLFDSGTHLDFRYITPQESQWIKIDQIRELIHWAMATPQISNKKVAILSPAHSMNLQAANAFLKTLEEPSLRTLFILVTDKPALIPATVRSRCYWVRIRNSFDQFNAHSELKTILERDLRLLEEKQINPISISNEWSKHPPKEILHWLLVILSELINKSALENKLIRNTQSWQFIENVFEAKRTLEAPNQPNVQLMIESLLIKYTLCNRILG